jgi:hypothetical protein
MIISASYRTDIPAFYGAWFEARLAEGSVRVANPYGGPERVVPLTPQAVDGFVFWTRNLRPFLPVLARLNDQGFPFVVQMTITGYPRAIDAATVAPAAAVEQLQEVARLYGRRAAVWRYDPVVASSLTPPDWHAANFERLSEALAGPVDEVVLSFAQVYAKTKRNLDRAAVEHDFQWSDPAEPEKTALLARLGGIARAAGLTPSLCAQRELQEAAGLTPARCVDDRRLSDLAGKPIAAANKSHRKECGCAASVDIGAYDSCPHGCAYCYAVRSREAAKKRFAEHDSASARL